MKYLRTSDLARAVGAHPNTVRRYAEWGLIPPVQRASNGYRLFTWQHLDCFRVARLIYGATYASRTIRQSAFQVTERAVLDDWGGALERAYAHLTLVQAERAPAEAAATLMERWAAGAAADATVKPMQIGQVARLLGVSIDMLRNWERNGLVSIPRDPANGYRRYGAAEISRLRVIRMLSRAGYSMMAILRMMLQLDQGNTANLRHSLNTPLPDEDVYAASDRWLTTLADQEDVARRLIALVEDIIAARTAREKPF
jgi:DNA-binding transcriptional MerR regulator